MNVNVFERPETVPIHCEDKDWTGTYIDPSAGITIDIYKPDGTKKVDAGAMSKVTTGKYVYYYNSEATDPAGWWRYSCKAVDGSGAGARTVITKGSFQLN